MTRNYSLNVTAIYPGHIVIKSDIWIVINYRAGHFYYIINNFRFGDWRRSVKTLTITEKIIREILFWWVGNNYVDKEKSCCVSAVYYWSNFSFTTARINHLLLKTAQCFNNGGSGRRSDLYWRFGPMCDVFFVKIATVVTCTELLCVVDESYSWKTAMLECIIL